MRTLVIGGTLFIGREIVRQLAHRGFDVTVLHRRDHHDLGPEIKNVQADRGDLPALTRVLRDGRARALRGRVHPPERGRRDRAHPGAADQRRVPDQHVEHLRLVHRQPRRGQVDHGRRGRT